MNTPGRQSIRLVGYDYTRSGAYFVTVCVQDRLCLFGDVIEKTMVLNEAGRMVQNVWQSLPLHNSGITLDEFMVMPNHFHGIVVLDGQAIPPVRQWSMASLLGKQGREAQRPAPTISLPDVMQRFKSITTALYRQGKWPGMKRRLWQRNYYERIIQGKLELKHVRQYIKDNPKN